MLALRRFRAILDETGRLAQLVERLLYTQDVGGSSPSPPTKPIIMNLVWLSFGGVRLA